MQWNPSLFQVIESSDTGQNEHWFMQSFNRTGVTDHRICFQPLGTSREAGLTLQLQQRLICHYVLTRIPDEGINEVMESLADMWLFYAKKSIQNIPLAITSSPSKIARRGEQYTRPDFHASTD